MKNEYILGFFGRKVGEARKGVEKDYITGRGRQKERVRARDLLCYWTVVELGMPMVDLARKFDITPSSVSHDYRPSR